MTDNTTLTVRLTDDLKAQLAKLAHYTKRVERGRADVKAGRCVSNDEAFRQVDDVIEAAQGSQWSARSFGPTAR